MFAARYRCDTGIGDWLIEVFELDDSLARCIVFLVVCMF